MTVHPCQNCGACCGRFQVQFDETELETADAQGVPRSLARPLETPHRWAMATGGTQSNRCLALQGEIGSYVHCSIYDNRPSPCRAFMASFENGAPNPRCDEARRALGMEPLRFETWSN